MCVEKISKQVLAAVATGSLWWPPGQVAAAVDTEGVARKGGTGSSLTKDGRGFTYLKFTAKF